MAGVETLEIFRELEALVSDKLQVVSYKWLSRNFLVSSNYAKRLLSEFVEKHGNELKVVYTLSGWLKNNPQTYCIKLAMQLNLAEVKQEFKDNCSVQVYSIQGCIPNDLALLWSAEFVQAEELFNQPLIAENCLRDNRFCAVSNSYVKRTVDGKASAVSQPNNNPTVSLKPKASPMMQSSAKNAAQPSSKVSFSSKAEKGPSADKQPSMPQVAKQSTTVTHASKKKDKNDNLSGGDGSLTSLWGRASVKPKSSSPSIDAVAPKIDSAEAQICAHEATDAMSSDNEEADINCKRVLNGSSNRKRRVVMDYSDEDEEEEYAVNLASPDPPTVKSGPDSPKSEKMIEKKNLGFEDHNENVLEVKQEKCKDDNFGLSGGVIKTENKNDITGISIQKKSQTNISKETGDEIKKENDKTTTGSTAPKKRKVLKTRIDERGREVTEVVWEGEAADNNTDKTAPNHDVGSRPPIVNKAQAAGSNASTNPANKAGNKKPAKGGGKNAKQGNILSFFKKV